MSWGRALYDPERIQTLSTTNDKRATKTPTANPSKMAFSSCKSWSESVKHGVGTIVVLSARGELATYFILHSGYSVPQVSRQPIRAATRTPTRPKVQRMQMARHDDVVGVGFKKTRR